MAEPAVYEGGCHCGKVRFRVKVRTHQAISCNCSMCQKRANLHLIVDPEDFELLSGAEVLTVYEFNTKVAKHRFCSICGIHPFYTPRSHPDKIDVNVRCLDGDAATAFGIGQFDGQNWEENVGKIR